MYIREIRQLQVEKELLKKVQTTVRERAGYLEPEHKKLSIARQCKLLGISRSAYYYNPSNTVTENDILILEDILGELEKHPFYVYRKIAFALRGLSVKENQIRRIMKKARLQAIYPKKRLFIPVKWHIKYPYLLRDKKICVGKRARYNMPLLLIKTIDSLIIFYYIKRKMG